MGKKYLDIKKDSLEESILEIWQTAAEEADTKMDGRTKGYKSHRSKLESRRTKKEEKKKLGEGSAKYLEVEFKDSTTAANAYSYINNKIEPGGTQPWDDFNQEGSSIQFDNMKDADSLMKELKRKFKFKVYERESAKLDEARQLKDPKKEMLVVKGGKVVAIDKKDAKEYLNKGWTVAESIENSVLRIWQTAADGTKVEEKKSYEIGTDEYREYLERLTPGEPIEEKKGDKEAYQKFFNSALKKFGVKSPAELKGDKKKEFFDYVDKNWTGDHEEAFEFAKKSKIDSMKEAIAKVWSFSEGELPPALKKAIDDKKKDKEEKDEDKEIKGNKTLTGKKAAVVEVDPEPDLENRKKKKSDNPYH